MKPSDASIGTRRHHGYHAANVDMTAESPSRRRAHGRPSIRRRGSPSPAARGIAASRNASGPATNPSAWRGSDSNHITSGPRCAPSHSTRAEILTPPERSSRTSRSRRTGGCYAEPARNRSATGTRRRSHHGFGVRRRGLGVGSSRKVAIDRIADDPTPPRRFADGHRGGSNAPRSGCGRVHARSGTRETSAPPPSPGSVPLACRRVRRSAADRLPAGPPGHPRSRSVRCPATQS